MSLKWLGIPDLCPHGKYQDQPCDKCEIERLKAEIARLQAIVDRLPTTEDGVPVTPGMDVWNESGHRWPLSGYQVIRGKLCVVYARGGFSAIGPWYSTEEAAKAAKEKR